MTTNDIHTILGAMVITLVAGCVGDGVHSQVGGDGAHSDPSICDQPDGPAHPYTQQSELEQLVLGRWQHCAGPTLLGQSDEAGIELTADHTYHVLVDHDGALVRASGFDGQGTWDAYQE